MSTTPTIRTYEQATAWLGRRDERTLYLRATRLHRRSASTIAVRYHETDVVTYQADGWITLRTNGWYTNTTMSRMEQFAPVAIARRGRWWLYTRPEGERPDAGRHAFADGMTVRGTEVLGALDLDQSDAEDAQNRKVRRTVNQAMRNWRAGGHELKLHTCGACVLIRQGTTVADRGHLLDHLAQMRAGWLSASTAEAAVVMAGQRLDLYALVIEPRHVRNLLLSGLYVGATSPVPSGRRPVGTHPNWRAA